MAKKKTAIGDLIKSDMSRRSIGEEPKIIKKAKTFPTEAPVKKPEEKKEPAAKPASPLFADTAPVLKGSAVFSAFINEQMKSVGLIDEAALNNFYKFLQSQAMRYIRGFDAGRRFHG